MEMENGCAMKHFLSILFSAVVIMMTVAACDKESLKLYHDYNGNSISLIGSWGLVEVQCWTAGVVRTEKFEPESLMEFMEGGLGKSVLLRPDGSRETIATFHWEKVSSGSYNVNVFARF